MYYGPYNLLGIGLVQCSIEKGLWEPVLRPPEYIEEPTEHILHSKEVVLWPVERVVEHLSAVEPNPANTNR